jgi:hypothetical protein
MKNKTLADFYCISELRKIPELNYMTTTDFINYLKQNNIRPLTLSSPFNGQKIFLKTEIDEFVQQEKNI